VLSSTAVNPPSSSKRKLYVNTETGLYTCFVCGASGGTYLLQKHFGDEPTKARARHRPAHPPQDPELGGRGRLGHAHQQRRHPVPARQAGPVPETIVDRKLGYVGGGWSLTGSLPESSAAKSSATPAWSTEGRAEGRPDFYYDHLLIPYLSRGNVVQIRGRQGAPRPAASTSPAPATRPCCTASTTSTAPRTSSSPRASSTDGPRAAPAHRRRRPGPSLRRRRPGRRQRLQGGFESYFTNAKRVYLGLDPDDTGKREAVKIKEALGTRARILELPSELPKCDWSDYLLPVPADAPLEWRNEHPHAGHTWRDVMQLLGTAAGKRVFSIREPAAPTARHASRGRGSRQASPPSTPSSHPDCARDRCSSSSPRPAAARRSCSATWRSTCAASPCCSSPSSRPVKRSTSGCGASRCSTTRGSRRGARGRSRERLHLRREQARRQGRRKLIEKPRDRGRRQARRRHVDYLQLLRPRRERQQPVRAGHQRRHALKEIAKKNRLVIISPSQVNRLAKEGQPIDLDDARDSGAIEETADFLLSLWRPDEGTEAMGNENVPPSGKVRIGTLKSRHGGKGKVFSLVMDLLTLAIVDEHGAAARTVRDHNHLLWRGTTYAQLRTHETKPTQLPMDSEGHGYGQ
jgi:hypothetical protein